MADVKISELTAKPTDAASTDEFPANSGGTTYKITTAQVTAGLTYASEAQARAGTAEDVVMDPLQVANAIDELAGDVVGPASSTDSAVALYDGTTGKLLKNGVPIGVASGNILQSNQAEASTASATTTALGSTTLKHGITGTATITAFSGVAGNTYKCRADGAFTLTFDATNLDILQTGASIVAAADDTFDVYMRTTSTCEIRNYQRASGEALAGGSGLPSPDFTSSEQTITNDTILNVAHGLGSIPKMVLIVLRCKTADLGYSVGDEVVAGVIDRQSSADKGITVHVDATNVTLVQGSAQGLLSRSTFNSTSITNSSWRWEVRAWA